MFNKGTNTKSSNWWSRIKSSFEIPYFNFPVISRRARNSKIFVISYGTTITTQVENKDKQFKNNQKTEKANKINPLKDSSSNQREQRLMQRLWNKHVWSSWSTILSSRQSLPALAGYKSFRTEYIPVISSTDDSLTIKANTTDKFFMAFKDT